jgi:hypothetical protein
MYINTKNVMNQTRYFVMRVQKVAAPTVLCCNIFRLVAVIRLVNYVCPSVSSNGILGSLGEIFVKFDI